MNAPSPTPNLPPLTSEQSTAVIAAGVAVVRPALAGDALGNLTAWTEEVAAWPERPGGRRHRVYHETGPDGGFMIQRIERLAPVHSGFRSLCEALLPWASTALGEPARLFKEKINFKLPGGMGFKPHQDVQAGWEAYAPRFVSILIAIDPMNAASGCVEFAPGQPARRHADGAPIGGEDLAALRFEPITMAPGDAAVFDGLVPHRSGPNRTANPRRAYYVTFAPASAGPRMEAYYADKFASFPPEIDRDPARAYRFKV